MITRLKAEEWLKLNAALQQKKNKVREKLREMGVLERKGSNAFDHYKYFSEAQYKQLFTELFAQEGLELTASVREVTPYKGTPKQEHGRTAEVEYTLTDIDSGFYEKATITGDGMDKGDKGLYKAYTGSLKYYLANTFMVATGDDPEVPDREAEEKITARKAKTLAEMIEKYGVPLDKVLQEYEHKKLEDFTENEFASCLLRLEATRRKKEQEENA